jgi:predicted nucleic acid-binding protein
VLLDSSGLLCLIDNTERYHIDAVRFWHAARTRMTSNYVLAEFVALAHARRAPRQDALNFAADLLADPMVEVIWVDEGLHQQALALLQARLDKTYSLCDAVSFLLMRERGLSEALTTDRHFEQEGFVRLLAP